MALNACLECGNGIPPKKRVCPRCGAKLPMHPVLVWTLTALGIAGFCGLLAAGAVFLRATQETASITGDNVADAPSSDARSDLVPTVAATIRSHGHSCPVLVNLWDEGPRPVHLEVLCGPDRNHVDPSLHYAVYMRRDVVNVCEPWKAFGPDCI